MTYKFNNIIVILYIEDRTFNILYLSSMPSLNAFIKLFMAVTNSITDGGLTTIYGKYKLFGVS